MVWGRRNPTNLPFTEKITDVNVRRGLKRGTDAKITVTFCFRPFLSPCLRREEGSPWTSRHLLRSVTPPLKVSILSQRTTHFSKLHVLLSPTFSSDTKETFQYDPKVYERCQDLPTHVPTRSGVVKTVQQVPILESLIFVY